MVKVIGAWQLDAKAFALQTALTLMIRLMLHKDSSVTKAQDCATSTASQQENVRILMEHLGILVKSMVINATSNAMKLGKNSAMAIIMVGKHVPM